MAAAGGTGRLRSYHHLVTPEGITLVQKYGVRVADMTKKQATTLSLLWGDGFDSRTRPIIARWAQDFELSLRLGTPLNDPPDIRVQAVQGAGHPPPHEAPGRRAPPTELATQQRVKGGKGGKGCSGDYSPVRRRTASPISVGWGNDAGEPHNASAGHKGYHQGHHGSESDWDDDGAPHRADSEAGAHGQSGHYYDRDWRYADKGDRSRGSYDAHRDSGRRAQGEGWYCAGGGDDSPGDWPADWPRNRSPEPLGSWADTDDILHLAAATTPRRERSSPAPRSPRGGGKGAAGWGSMADGTRGPPEFPTASPPRAGQAPGSPPSLAERLTAAKKALAQSRKGSRPPAPAAPPEGSPPRRSACPAPASPTARRHPEHPALPAPQGKYVPPSRRGPGADSKKKKWEHESPAVADDMFSRLTEEAAAEQRLANTRRRHAFFDGENARRSRIADEQARDFGPICGAYAQFQATLALAANRHPALVAQAAPVALVAQAAQAAAAAPPPAMQVIAAGGGAGDGDSDSNDGASQGDGDEPAQ